MNAVASIIFCVFLVSIGYVQGFVDCRCELPKGGPRGVRWISICDWYPHRYPTDESECMNGMTKDFCGCCDVCVKGPGEICYVYPAQAQPMGCMEGYTCTLVDERLFEYRCVPDPIDNIRVETTEATSTTDNPDTTTINLDATEATTTEEVETTTLYLDHMVSSTDELAEPLNKQRPTKEKSKQVNEVLQNSIEEDKLAFSDGT